MTVLLCRKIDESKVNKRDLHTENYLPVTPQLFNFFRTDNNTRSSIVWIYDRIYTTR